MQFTQTEVKQLQETVKSTSAQLKEAKKKLASLSELERRQIKQECYTRRSNIKFFGIKDNDEESPSDTEETLRHFLTKEMKIPRGDVDKIEFERVHRIPTKPSTEKETKSKTRHCKSLLLSRQRADQVPYQEFKERIQTRGCRRLPERCRTN